MGEDLEKLQIIGVQKLHEKTHIPVKYIQALLNGTFEDLSKVQFLGFVSILERDYGFDLSELRLKGINFFEEKNNKAHNNGIFMPQPKKKKFAFFYILLGIMVFASIVYISTNSSDQSAEKLKVDSSLIMDVQKNIEAASVSENNLSSEDANHSIEDTNETLKERQEEIVQKNLKEETLLLEAPALETLKIVAQKKLWLGYVDIENNIQYNKTFTGELELDGGKEWLLFFGHRFAEIISKGERFQISSQNRARFLYKDGVIKSLDAEEFKRLNRGKEW